MKLLFAMITAALSFGFTTASYAQSTAMSTEELQTYCKGSEDSFVTCEIYGQAVYDTYLVFSQHNKAPKFICIVQPAPSRKEVIQEYVAWADANPKYAKDPAADSILRFLGGRFPCDNAGK
jgi:hypothetical protein